MRQIGKYTILEELGKGGMGTVFKARDPVIRRDVALKFIQERMLSIPEVKQRFYREARSAGKLSHENIMVVYDVGEHEGYPYIVMEFLAGTDLRALLHAAPPLTLEQKLSISIQICKGLYYAHQRQVVHRDIKPENIRVLEDGRVKIMDFGIARVESSTQTLTKASIGTPRYMSPEQIRDENVDHRTDIFSFGVLLYELLTGINPFTGTQVTAVIYKILNTEPDPVNLENTELSSDLQDIVLRCLEKNPEERYQNFGEVVSDLTQVYNRLPGNTAVLSSGAAPDSAPRGKTRQKTEPQPDRELPSFPRWKRLGLGALFVVALLAALYVLLPLPPIGSADSPSVTTQPPADPALNVPAATSSDSTEAGGQDPVVPEDTTAIADAGVEPADPPADPPEEREADEDDEAEQRLQALRTSAATQQRRMLQERTNADAANASTAAPGLYGQARREEQDGQSAFRRGDESGYRTASRAFASATQSYASATAAATHKPNADRSQQAMEQARDAVYAQRNDAAIADTYQRAEQLRGTGNERYNGEAFEEAGQAFREAQALYVQVKQTLDTPVPPTSTGSQTQADAARTAMQTAKGGVHADNRQAPAYQQALNLEQEATQFYQANTFDAAEEKFNEARARYADAAALPSPDELAREQIQRLVQRFKQSFEAEDLEALNGLTPFYGSWEQFFRDTSEIEAQVNTRSLDVQGNSATLQLTLQLNYKDNKNRPQSSDPINHTWTLEQSGGTWRIAQVR